MQHEQQNFGGIKETIAAANGLVNLFVNVASGWAATIYPFTRRQFGSRYFGIWQALGMPISWLFAVTTCTPDTIWPFTYYTYAILFALFLQKFSTANALRKKGYFHSRYTGWPVICNWLPISEKNAKLLVEPILVSLFGIGVLLLTSHSIGVYWIIGGVAMLIDTGSMVEVQRRRAMDIRDQEILNQCLSNELESMR